MNTPTAHWRHRLRLLGPPPTLPNGVLTLVDGSDLSAVEIWLGLGGERSRWSYAEINYAAQWLAIPLRVPQGAQAVRS